MKDAVARELINQSAIRMEESTERIIRCMAILEEKDIWYSPNEHLNSAGNLILHLCGNMRQWIMYGVDRQPDVRVREPDDAPWDQRSRAVAVSQV